MSLNRQTSIPTYTRPRSQLAPWVVLVVGLLLSALLYSIVHQGEYARSKVAFLDAARDRRVAIQDTLDLALEPLSALAAFFNGSNSVTRQEFDSFAADILSTHPEILAVEWLPKVARAEREAFERRAVESGFPDFEIKDATDRLQFKPAAERHEYFPVHYVWPLAPNRAALGLDHYSFPFRARAMDTARVTREPVAVAGVPLYRFSSEPEETLNCAAFAPVYTASAHDGITAPAPETLEGFAVVLVRIDAVIRNLETRSARMGIDLLLFRADDYEHSSPLWPRMPVPAEASGTSEQPRAAFGFESAETVQLPGLNFRLVARATREFVHAPDYRGAWTILAISVAISFLGFALTRVMLRRLEQAQAFARTIEREVQQRREAEAAARSSEMMFQTYMDHTQAVAFIKDSDGRYVFINRHWELTFGKSALEVIGRTDAEFREPDEAERLRAADQRVLTSGKPEELIERFRSADGSMRSWFVSKFPLHDPVRGRSLGGFGVDITERQQLEAQLLQSQKMEAVGQLAGGVAHDFNNLLTVIQGNASILRVASLPEPQKVEALAEIAQASERAAALTRQLLAFSRRQAMQPRRIDLNELVSNIARMLRRVLGEHVQLELNLATEPVWTFADPGMIDQAIMNLAINARDAMPHGGSLSVQTGMTPAPTSNRGDENASAPRRECALLRMTDTGTGITAEVLPHIFEPFFTTKAPGKGTGLGLATVFGIVKQHGGSVRVSSEPGLGTTFEIELPAADGDAAEVAEADIAAEIPKGSETILLVEDEEPVRKFVRRVLEGHGYTVHAVENGREALKFWKDHGSEFDLVLTDVIMPGGLSGPQMVAELRHQASEVPALYMSGYTGAQGMDLPPDDVAPLLRKPFTPMDLLAAIRTRLHEARSRQTPR